VDIISSDSFGEFPDKSIADAVRRLPGITVERGQGDGEGRYVTIRGMNADFNAVSLNGVRVAVSNFDNASRSVPLDVVSSRSAETIEVTKAIRPDQDADAIGGAVNIRTRSPFDRDGRTITMDSALTYNNLLGRYGQGYYLDPYGYEFGASFSDVITKDGKWAAAVTVNTRRTPYGSQSVDVRGWTTVDDGGGPLDGLYVPTGVLL
jgi:TonB-dependent receptor